ncbi:MAG TPA: AbrB/MazE/SpoVT family DNA-binding domain-containing protein [Bryobacteraceae bacterium]
MRVAKWGNSLAVRLPAAVVKALNLKEGDQIEIRVTGKRKFEVARDADREWALKAMERLRVPFPPDFKFNREELYERGKNDEGR